MWSFSFLLSHTLTHTYTPNSYTSFTNAIFFFFGPFWTRFDGQFESLFVFVMWVNLAYAFYFISFHSFIYFFIFSRSKVDVSVCMCVPFIFCSLLDYGNAKHSLSFGCPALKMYERRSPDKIKQCDVAHTFPDFSSAVRIYQSSTFRFFCLSLSLCVCKCVCG